MKKVRSDLILRQLAKRHTHKTSGINDVFLTEVKNGQTWFNNEPLRLDAIAIRKSWAKPLVVAYEVKVDRADFLRDTKWPKYLELCHEFYFACPNGLISEDEIEPAIGLIWYNPEKDCITTKRKAVYRRIEIPKDMLWYLVMTRLGSDSKHPFFSSQREYFEAWVQEKENKRELGRLVAIKVMDRMRDMERKISDLEARLSRADRDKKQLDEIYKIAVKYGANHYELHNNLAEFLDEALKISLPPEIARLIYSLERDVSRLKAMIQGGDPGGNR